MIGDVIERALLSRAERAAMCALMMRHYEGVSREVFERDLADKDYVIRVRDEAGALRGFTTMALRRAQIDGERVFALYSGDTIVDPTARRSSALARTWIDSVRQLREGLGGERLVWLLICSGPRTYRFLPVFFQSFYPRHDAPTPASIDRAMRALAAQRYGAAFEPRTGIVRLSHPQPLREDDAPGPALDDHVRCFFERNPGHAAGDELVCYCELDDANLTRAGRRMAAAGERARVATLRLEVAV